MEDLAYKDKFQARREAYFTHPPGFLEQLGDGIVEFIGWNKEERQLKAQEKPLREKQKIGAKKRRDFQSRSRLRLQGCRITTLAGQYGMDKVTSGYTDTYQDNTLVFQGAN